MRRYSGRDTFKILRDWDSGQTASERFSIQLLANDGYTNIDPSHPRGGPDGKKDGICYKGESKFVMACYFPNGQKEFSEIKEKFTKDFKGVKGNTCKGIVFVTNQELTLSEREELLKMGEKNKIETDLYHLERISSIVNIPKNYGIRLEYLGIEMSKEEQLSALATKDQQIQDLFNFISQNKVVEESNNISSAITVSSEKHYYPPYSSAGVSFAGFNKCIPYHKCGHCGYGFKVATDYSSISASMARFDISGFNLLNAQPELELVTCPKCGNVDSI